MKIGLKAGERLYINGAVIRAERKTNIELLNDAVFLLEAHVLQPEDATTPLRQLYFILQTMIIDPQSAATAQEMFHLVLGSVKAAFSTEEVLNRLEEVEELAKTERWFEAMKIVRSLYPIEAKVMQENHRREAHTNSSISPVPARGTFQSRAEMAAI
ncbi:flagellar biosynthesis repressor FlbT [Roseibium aggregatum]|uniref:Flagellar biosynthesis repressor FlbT n=1 Tax=Roseibium aggregatum TaxID=187304 RepID=A0A939J044_9HYPH|nr:flagellar biosynthesis repressor FlbT [Roseibium aggregatum]MBN9670721.1 flagellar biosynthesis repressor FlbT [Roseibium aggregatum]